MTRSGIFIRATSSLPDTSNLAPDVLERDPAHRRSTVRTEVRSRRRAELGEQPLHLLAPQRRVRLDGRAAGYERERAIDHRLAGLGPGQLVHHRFHQPSRLLALQHHGHRAQHDAVAALVEREAETLERRRRMSSRLRPRRNGRRWPAWTWAHRIPTRRRAPRRDGEAPRRARRRSSRAPAADDETSPTPWSDARSRPRRCGVASPTARRRGSGHAAAVAGTLAARPGTARGRAPAGR